MIAMFLGSGEMNLFGCYIHSMTETIAHNYNVSVRA